MTILYLVFTVFYLVFFAFTKPVCRPVAHLTFLIIVFALISVNSAFASKPACENICVKKKSCLISLFKAVTVTVEEKYKLHESA